MKNFRRGTLPGHAKGCKVWQHLAAQTLYLRDCGCRSPGYQHSQFIVRDVYLPLSRLNFHRKVKLQMQQLHHLQCTNSSHTIYSFQPVIYTKIKPCREDSNCTHLKSCKHYSRSLIYIHLDCGKPTNNQLTCHICIRFHSKSIMQQRRSHSIVRLTSVPALCRAQ